MAWKFVKGTVVANQPVDRDVWQMEIECPEIAGACQPGNFVMLRAWEGDVYLPRPMAVFHSSLDSFDIVYKIKGIGTKLLSNLKAGAEIIVTGPLGKAVEHDFRERSIALVGRGVGIMPLLPLAQAAATEGADIYSFLSARTARSLVGAGEFAARGLMYTQIDEENDGRVTEQLQIKLEQGIHLDMVYVSGSQRLLRHCLELRAQYGFAVYVFLEERMACGIGHCRGCAIEIKNGSPKYALCCKEGPLFLAESVAGL
ncbi:MAG: iron-sulfur cluster-binding protein [Desulfitobacteriaceae bacterium]